MRRYGHRGACGHAPENTRASFVKALELAVDGVEFDIQLSSDNEPMVIHDNTLERTTNGRGKVGDFSYWELQQFDAGNGNRIPHLRDVFLLIDKRCDLLIELKCDAVAAVDKVIREQVATGWNYKNIWVLGFNHTLLAKMHALNPQVHICASFEEYPVDLARAREATGATAIAPHHHVIDASLMNAAAAHGLKIFTWTVNKPSDITQAKSLGVDGIISDLPERV
jgi:glycerophosphoryl diester phosphodiesterase